MVESNIEPANVTIDCIENGIATVRVVWNKEQVTRDNVVLWQYDECRMRWTLPAVYASKAEVRAYLDANYSSGETILNWAKASKMQGADLS
jgi:hypothetical protein